MPNDSLFQEVIRKGDLGKAAQLANSVLQIVTQETKMNLEKKIKVNAITNVLYFMDALFV